MKVFYVLSLINFSLNTSLKKDVRTTNLLFFAAFRLSNSYYLCTYKRVFYFRRTFYINYLRYLNKDKPANHYYFLRIFWIGYPKAVNAYNQDMGINSTYEHFSTYNGQDADPEVSNHTVQDVVFYLQTLKHQYKETRTTPMFKQVDNNS